jgi:phage shock protein PspC (stress-responsive transcriptional regulator)
MTRLLKSKKFWITVVGVGGVIAGKYFGIDEETIKNYTAMVCTLVAAIAGVDIAEAVKK